MCTQTSPATFIKGSRMGRGIILLMDDRRLWSDPASQRHGRQHLLPVRQCQRPGQLRLVRQQGQQQLVLRREAVRAVLEAQVEAGVAAADGDDSREQPLQRGLSYP